MKFIFFLLSAGTGTTGAFQTEFSAADAAKNSNSNDAPVVEVGSSTSFNEEILPKKSEGKTSSLQSVETFPETPLTAEQLEIRTDVVEGICLLSTFGGFGYVITMKSIGGLAPLRAAGAQAFFTACGFYFGADAMQSHGDGARIPVVVFWFLRNCSAMILGFLMCKYLSKPLQSETWDGQKFIGIRGVIGGINSFLNFAALSFISPAMHGLISTTMPFWTMFLVYIFVGESVKPIVNFWILVIGNATIATLIYLTKLPAWQIYGCMLSATSYLSGATINTVSRLIMLSPKERGEVIEKSMGGWLCLSGMTTTTTSITADKKEPLLNNHAVADDASTAATSTKGGRDSVDSSSAPPKKEDPLTISFGNFITQSVMAGLLVLIFMGIEPFLDVVANSSSRNLSRIVMQSLAAFMASTFRSSAMGKQQVAVTTGFQLSFQIFLLYVSNDWKEDKGYSPTVWAAGVVAIAIAVSTSMTKVYLA